MTSSVAPHLAGLAHEVNLHVSLEFKALTSGPSRATAPVPGPLSWQETWLFPSFMDVLHASLPALPRRAVLTLQKAVLFK